MPLKCPYIWSLDEKTIRPFIYFSRLEIKIESFSRSTTLCPQQQLRFWQQLKQSWPSCKLCNESTGQWIALTALIRSLIPSAEPLVRSVCVIPVRFRVNYIACGLYGFKQGSYAVKLREMFGGPQHFPWSSVGMGADRKRLHSRFWVNFSFNLLLSW